MRFFSFREINDEPKPFLDHIEDFRIMLFKMLGVLVVMMIVAFFLQGRIVHLIERPLLAIDPQGKSLVNFGVTDPLMITFSLSFYAGLVLSFPFLIFFLAEFVLPALTPGERRMLYPVAAISFGLFAVGVVFAYEFVLPPTLRYFFGYSESLDWKPQWSVKEYFSFTTQFVLSFGLAFELPLAVLCLVKLNILTYEILRRTRAYAVVGIFFLAAIIVPSSDILTLMLMGCPMYLLYEGCIWIAWLMERKARRRENLEIEKIP